MGELTTRPYLISFTPVNRFFFGSYRSFSEGFYAVSMKYPQPTTILGFLRYTMLAQKGKNPRDPMVIACAKDLTGTWKGDDLGADDENLGLIARVSPLFIVKWKKTAGQVEDILFPAPVDVEVLPRPASARRIEYARTEGALSSYSGSSRKDYAVLSEKDLKAETVAYMGGRSFWSDYTAGKVNLPYDQSYEESRIILQDTNVGVGLNKKVVEEGMFYTKVDYTLAKGFSFGVIVWFTGDVCPLYNETLTMGGEQSPFMMEVFPWGESSFFEAGSHAVISAIVAGKDSLAGLRTAADGTVPSRIVALAPLVLGTASVAQFEYARINGIQVIRVIRYDPSGSIRRPESYCMAPAGSVLYPAGKAVSVDEPGKIPYKIGYNAVLTV